MLGCESGNCKVVLVSSRTGTSGGGVDNYVDPAAGLAIQPYQILGEDLDASGGVVALAITRNNDRPLALIVHRNSGAIVWDIRAERVISSAPDDEDDPSKPTSACWVGDRGNCYAVGYDDGSILVWGVPASALKANSTGKVTASEDSVIVMSLRVTPENNNNSNSGNNTSTTTPAAAAPVQSLTFLPGAEGTPGGEDCLLVCGGQAVSDPDMLTLLPLDPQGEIPPSTVPWFGTLKAHALMPRVFGSSNTGTSPSNASSKNHDTTSSVGNNKNSNPTSTEGAVSDDQYDALMVLTEGGQLVVHDLREWHPHPLTLPLQELPPITASKFVATVSEEQAAALTAEGPSKRVQHALTFPALIEIRTNEAKNRSGTSASGASGNDWPFTGGEPAVCDAKAISSGCHPSALLMTGHRDGKIRVWDSTAQVPVLITTVPSSGAIAATAASGQQQERLKAVVSFDVCPASGLLAVGHAGGDVRVYQFTDRPQSVRRCSIDESLVPYDTMLVQPAGFQYILKYSTHSVDCTAVSLASKLRLLTVGDCQGGVSAVDLTAPQRLFQTVPVVGEAVAKLAVGLAAANGGFSSNKTSGAAGGASSSSTLDGATTSIPSTTAETASSPTATSTKAEDVCLFVASQDSSLTMLALHSGEPAARTLRPKNSSRPLDLALLDAQGVPLLSPQGAVFLPWADNNAASAPRSLSMMKVKRMDTSTSTGSRRRSNVDLVGVPERFSTDQQDNTTTLRTPGGNGGGNRSLTPPLSSTNRPSTSASLEIHTLPSDEDDDDDLDAALGAAAAAVDAEKSNVRTSRFSIFQRKRSPSPEKKARTPSASSQYTAGIAGGGINTPGSGSGGGGGGVYSNEGNEEKEGFMPELALSPNAAASPSLGQYTNDDEDSVDRDHIALITEDSQEAISSVDEYGIDTSANLFGGLKTETGDNDMSSGGGGRGNSMSATMSVGPLGGTMVVDYPYIDCGLEDNSSFAAVEYVLLATVDYLRVYSTESVRLGDRTTDRKQKIDPSAMFAGVFLSESGPGVVSISIEGGINVHSVPNLSLLLSRPLSAPDVLGFSWRVPDESASAADAAWTCSLEGQVLLTAPGNEMARLLVVKDTNVPLGAASTFNWKMAKAARAASNAASALPSSSSSRIDRNSTGMLYSSVDTSTNPGNSPSGGQKFMSQVKGAAVAATGAVMQELERVRAGVLPPRELPTLRTLFETPVESLIIEDDIDFMPEEEVVVGGGVGAGNVNKNGEEDSSVATNTTSNSTNNRVAAAGAAAATAAVAVAGKAKDKAGYLANAALQGAATGGAKLKSLVPLGRRDSTDIDPLESVKMKESAARERRNDLLGTPVSTTMSGARGNTPSPYPTTGGGGGGASSRITTKSTQGNAAQRLHRRTTSEIKRTYGHTRSQDAKVTMERNRALLAERGQKLANLEEQAAVMRGDAEDFAGMAAELEAAFANRKWWQF
jgi:hypothetical protein